MFYADTSAVKLCQDNRQLIVITQHAKTIPINWYYFACPSKQLHLIGTTQDFISFLFTIMPAVPLLNLLLSQGP